MPDLSSSSRSGRTNALRGAVESIRVALRLPKEHGRGLRRAVLLRDLGDSLCIVRPHDWPERSRRAYAGAARRLHAAPFGIDVPAGTPRDVARQMVHEARLPLRRALIAVALLGAVVGALTLAGGCLLALTPAGSWIAPPDLAASATWAASSAAGGVPVSGRGPMSAGDHFFRTQRESHPWLEVELPRDAAVRAVRLERRAPQGEIGLPLNVEVEEGGAFHLACQRRAPFTAWTCHLPGAPVKAIRVVLAGEGALELRSVAVFE